MIDVYTPIRIYYDGGTDETYDIDNIIYSDDNIIVGKIIHPDFDEDVYVTINRKTKDVTSEYFRFYYAENYTPDYKFGVTISYKNIANITINKTK
jgi:hypothetical protein